MKEKIIEINGETIVIKKIVGVSQFKTISTGSALCDWCFGFVVYTTGTDIKILFKRYSSNSDEEVAKSKYQHYKKIIIDSI